MRRTRPQSTHSDEQVAPHPRGVPLASQRIRPVALVARAERPPAAPAGYRAPIDRALFGLEVLLIAVLLAAGVRWLAAGPVFGSPAELEQGRIATARTRLPTERAAAQSPASAQAAMARLAARKPSVSRQATASRGAAATATAGKPRAAPPQRPAGERAAYGTARLRRAHPELGDLLPGIGPRPAAPARSADYLNPALRFVPGTPPQPGPAAIAEPEAPAPDLRPVRLVAPTATIDTSVVEVFLQNNAWRVVDHAAGYLHGTGVPGDGNVVIAGHKGIGAAVFARLEQLQPGDDVFVDAAGARYHYRVRATGNVWPWAVEVMYPTHTPTLTLLTCTNWDMQRFVVVADLIDSAVRQ